MENGNNKNTINMWEDVICSPFFVRPKKLPYYEYNFNCIHIYPANKLIHLRLSNVIKINIYVCDCKQIDKIKYQQQ